MREIGENTGRRTVLKSLGAAAVPFGSVSVATAESKQSPQQVYEAALRVREETGSVEKFRNVLKRNNARIATSDVSVKKEWKPADQNGASTQQLDQSFFNLYMTMTSINYSDPYVDANWEITFTYDDGSNRKVGGELPDDIIGMSFEPRDYEYNTGTEYTGNSANFRKSGYQGATFEYPDITCEDYNDAGAECPPEFGTTVTVKDYAGYQVTPDETTDPSKRKVFTDYIHTYSQVEITSVGIDSAGDITVNLSDNTKKWDVPVEAVISEDELEYKSCC